MRPRLLIVAENLLILVLCLPFALFMCVRFKTYCMTHTHTNIA
jgi:hypothetical protein